ncbi:Phage integrase [Pseudomonas orientalis]|nr:Phage integrase [Pseudomonas orientalis]
MPAQNLRLSDRQLKGAKPTSKDYVLTDGDGLQLRVRSNGSLLWNFNYREPVTKKRINIGFGTYPELHWRMHERWQSMHASCSPRTLTRRCSATR